MSAFHEVSGQVFPSGIDRSEKVGSGTQTTGSLTDVRSRRGPVGVHGVGRPVRLLQEVDGETCCVRCRTKRGRRLEVRAHCLPACRPLPTGRWRT